MRNYLIIYLFILKCNILSRLLLFTPILSQIWFRLAFRKLNFLKGMWYEKNKSGNDKKFLTKTKYKSAKLFIICMNKERRRRKRVPKTFTQKFYCTHLMIGLIQKTWEIKILLPVNRKFLSLVKEKKRRWSKSISYSYVFKLIVN